MEALTAYTRGAAHAAFRERELGTLAPGFLADFVVLDGDGWLAEATQGEEEGVDAAEREKPKVLSTYVGGECKWGKRWI
jgi:predicted amidohydrolase YtcJ